MIKFFKLLAVIILVVIVLMLLVVMIGVGLYYLMQYVPCELIAYTETAILFLLVAIIVFIVSDE